MTTQADNPGHKPFKQCTKCEFEWPTREDFLSDPSLVVIGYQADFTGEKKGFFLFNHMSSEKECNTTLTVEVSDFWDLYRGPVYEEIQYGSDKCSGHCSRTDDLAACDAKCRNAPIRSILQEILKNAAENMNNRKG